MADTEETIEKLKKMSLSQRVLEMTTEIKVPQTGSTTTVPMVEGLDWNGLVRSLQGKKIRIIIDVLKEI